MNKMFLWIKNKPGLSLLILILFVITATTIKPNFYLLGWDNYSSYFNLNNNIFQTFFGTWREYRGLGLPSDSEATDIFRQLMYFVLHLALPEKVLDQVYICFSLILGVLSMYFLSYKILSREKIFPHPSYPDLFGFFSAFFYLFNLNTLSTFYFPMVMYVNRFFMLPVIFLSIYIFMSKKISLFSYLGIISVFLLSSGSFLTATIFITLFISFLLYGVSYTHTKRFITIVVLFFLTQLFWILPFINYTIQKSSIIPLAPAFITTNEVQLNKPESYYNLVQTLLFVPNFFYTQFYDITQSHYLHFYPYTYTSLVYVVLLLLFPLLYISGGLFILRHWRKYRIFRWVPLTILLFLFLTLKEFSPLGIMYHFFDTYIPYFGVLFRFGDTKFHPMIAFSASIAASFAIISFGFYINSHLHKYITKILYLCIIISTLYVFRGYLIGSLISPYKYVVLPSAYQEIASLINKDTDTFRVLQLPFAKEDYWKSYEWGMFGSSFLNFMINHPLFDKTFEPASKENVAIDNQIDTLLLNFQLIQNPQQKRIRAKQFAQLLEKAGIKYFINDQTIQSTLYSRGILLWQKFNKADTDAMAQELLQSGFAKEIKKYRIDLSLYAREYSQFHILTLEEKEILGKNKYAYISLLKLEHSNKQVSFIDNPTYTNYQAPWIQNPVFMASSHVIEEKNTKNILFYPFTIPTLPLTITSNKLEITSPLQTSSPIHIEVKKEKLINETTTHIIQISGHLINNKILELLFSMHVGPDINNHSFITPLRTFQVPLSSLAIKPHNTLASDYVSDWTSIGQKEFGSLRLAIGNYVIPFPILLSSNPTLLGTVAVQGNQIPFHILSFNKQINLSINSLSTTSNPNCFFDKLTDADYSVEHSLKGLHIMSKNQSTCFVASLNSNLQDANHIEIHLDATGEDANLDSEYTHIPTSKPLLTRYITHLAKPNLLRICVKEEKTDDCYNLHQFINIPSHIKKIIPLEHFLGTLQDMQLLISLKNTGYQQQDITIHSLDIDTFTSQSDGALTIPTNVGINTSINSTGPLTISFPKALSLYTYYFNPSQEGLYGFNFPCEDKRGYSTFRLFQGNILSYISNCYTEFYQSLPFSSKTFGIWNFSYNLLSGKYPRLIIDDGIYSYINTFVSLDQGYPNIPIFKKFQSPENIFSYKFNSVKQALEDISFQNAYGYIYPNNAISDYQTKKLTIHQDSENEGILMTKNLFFQPLASNWETLSIHGNSQKHISYTIPSSYSFKRILPSLWKVTIHDKKPNSLLLFNEGYDKQWKAYDSLLGALLGIGKDYPSLRCDGYANCFSFTNTNDSSYYIFYTPERLSFIGWIATLSGIIGFWIFYRYKRRNYFV